MDEAFNPKAFVFYLKNKVKLTWREIYWKVWAYKYLFKCSECDSYYHAGDLYKCMKSNSEMHNAILGERFHEVEW